MLKIAALASAAAAALVLAPYPAAAEMYAKASLGQALNGEANFGEGSLDLGDAEVLGLALGGDLGLFRVEFGASRISGANDWLVDSSAVSLAATAYLDFPISQRSQVFGGIGPNYIASDLSSFGSDLADGEGLGLHGVIGYARRFGDEAVVEIAWTRVENDDAVEFPDLLSVGLRLTL